MPESPDDNHLRSSKPGSRKPKVKASVAAPATRTKAAPTKAKAKTKAASVPTKPTKPKARPATPSDTPPQVSSTAPTLGPSPKTPPGLKITRRVPQRKKAYTSAR